MGAGTYFHSSKNGWTSDGVVPGGKVALFARESRELGQRALNAIERQNAGDIFDRFLAVRRAFGKK